MSRSAVPYLLERLRKRIADRRLVKSVGQFLKAGVLSEEQFLRTDAGTPQGGILSPLLANIALSAIEERYERWTYHRSKTQARRESDGVKAAKSARTPIEKLVAVCSSCAMPTTSWFWSRERRRTPSQRNPLWRHTCTGPRASSCHRKRRR